MRKATSLIAVAAALTIAGCSSGAEQPSAQLDGQAAAVAATTTPTRTTATATDVTTAAPITTQDATADLKAAAADAGTSPAAMYQAMTTSCQTTIDSMGGLDALSLIGNAPTTILDVTITGDTGTVVSQMDGQSPSTDTWTHTADGWRVTC